MNRLLAAAAAVTLGCITAGVALANHAWGKYHWARASNPFVLKVGDNVGPSWDAYLDEAIRDWNPSTVLDLTKVTGSSSGSSCTPVAGRIEVCNANFGATGWLGIAQIWAQRRGHITQGTAKMNDHYFNQASYNTPAWRRLVMCQEVAHDFGLGHQNEQFGPPNLGSCMDYTNDPDGGGSYGPSNEHPNAHDFAQLVTIYGHSDSTTTVGAAAPTDVPGKGKPFSEASRANGSEYVDHLPGGVTRLTHVFWAPFGD